jgi:hypothetical protein
MIRSTTRSLVAAGVTLASLALGSVAMAADEAPVALAPLTIQQQLGSCGFAVSNPGTPPNTTLIDLRDPGSTRDNPRVARIIVYADVVTANAAHEKAHLLAESRAQVDVPMNDDNGPQILPGYGGTVWRNNVALMESDAKTLNSLYTWDTFTDQAAIANARAFDLGFVRSQSGLAVDADIVSCVEQAFSSPQVTADQPALADADN